MCPACSDKVHKIRKQKPSETGIDDGAVTSGSGATHMSEGHREDKRYRYGTFLVLADIRRIRLPALFGDAFTAMLSLTHFQSHSCACIEYCCARTLLITMVASVIGL